MKGVYYKIPLDYKSLLNKNKSEKITIDESISQHISLMATTYLGECKFDDEYSTDVWKIDFDLLTNENYLKDIFGSSLKKVITKYEKRLELREILVKISYVDIGSYDRSKIKKSITIDIWGSIKETNAPYHFRDVFYIGPLSY